MVVMYSAADSEEFGIAVEEGPEALPAAYEGLVQL